MATQKFLNYAGLAKFWELIKGKFIAGVTVDANGVQFVDANGTAIEGAVIPMATAAGPGLMSAEQANTVNEFAAGVTALVPFIGFGVGETVTDGKTAANEVTLTDRKAWIDFKYDSTAKAIQVIDKNNGNAVLTSIDATAFIKDGMVSDVRLDDNNNLIIDFNTDSGIQDITLPLDKFIDVYEGGNGIIVETATGKKVININLAAGTESDKNYLAVDANGLKTTGIDAAIDNAKNALIGTAGDTKDSDTIEGAKKYADAQDEVVKTTLIGTAGDTKDSDTIKGAKKYADTAVAAIQSKVDGAIQSVTAGDSSTYVTVTEPDDNNDVVVDLSAAAKASLGKADTAIQSVTAGDSSTYVKVESADNNRVVDLSDAAKTSLGYADDAVTSIVFTDKTITANVDAHVATIDIGILSDDEITAIVNGTAAA